MYTGAMSLNAYAAERRLRIYEELRAGKSPSEGAYDEAQLREARTKGQPQMGATRFAPDSIIFEFIYPDPKAAPSVLELRLAPPERIVFMPVPAWVVESIWQGEIDGSYQFESDADRMLEEFRLNLEPEANEAIFGTKGRVGRG